MAKVRQLTLAVVTALQVSASGTSAAAQPPDAAARETTRQIETSAAAIVGAWPVAAQQLPPRAKAHDLPPPTLTDVTLTSAMGGEDLRLQLVTWSNRTVFGRAWVGGRGRLPRYARVLEEDVRSNGVSLRVNIHLPDVPPGNRTPPDECAYEVSLTFAADKVSGTYRTSGVELEPLPIPAAKGKLIGRRAPLKGAPAGPGGPRAGSKPGSARSQWSLVVGMMRQYLLLDAVLSHGVEPAVAWETGGPLLPALSPGSSPVAGGAPEVADLGELDLDLGLDGDLGLGPADSEEAPPVSAADQQLMQSVLVRLRAAAESWAASLASPGAAPGAAAAGADPDFGPWYGLGSLATNQARANLLPDDAAATGNPLWRFVRHWDIVGPFPVGRPELLSWKLPDFVDLADASYLTDTGAMTSNGPTIWPKSPRVSWQHMPRHLEEGLQRPWTTSQHKGGGVGGTYTGPSDCRSYARTQVHAARAVDLWVAVGADDRCRLWVNDELVAVSVDGPHTPERIAIGKASFRKGANTMVVRCDNVNDSARPGRSRNTTQSHFWAKVAVRGAPRDPAAVKARHALVAEREAAVSARPSALTGYRNNGAGYYPDARPVTAWNIDSGHNVMWRAHLELEAWGKNYTRNARSSKAPPVVMGDRLALLLEPHFVICLDKATGKVLWERECNVLEFTAPDKLEQVRELWKRYADARTALMALGRDGPEREATLLRRGMDAEAAEAELSRMGGAVGKWGGDGKKGDDTFWKLMYEHGKFGRSGYGAWTGYSYASPVTDGRHVWVKFSTGVAACFDRDGKRRWMTQIPAGGGYAVCHAPILAGDLLVVSFGDDTAQSKLGQYGSEYTRLMGLDAATGAERWRSDPLIQPSATGSPVGIRATDGREDVDLIVTAAGAVLRADTGELVAHPHLIRSDWGTPTADGRDVYHCGGGRFTAHRAVMIDRDCIGFRRWWQRVAPCGFDGGLAFSDGLLYGSGGGQGPSGYAVFDTHEQRLARYERPDRGRQVWRGIPPQVNGRQYVPTIAAGDYVFVGQHGSAFSGRIAPLAVCGVMQRRWNGMLVGHSFVERAWTAPPVFDGDRTYIRTDPSLICIGYTGDEGRAYEADVNSLYMLGDLEVGPPADTEPIDIEPMDAAAAPRAAEFQRYMSYPIEVFGHFSVENAGAVLEVLNGPGGIAAGRAGEWPRGIAGEQIHRWSHGHCGMYGHAATGDNAHFKGVAFGKGAYFYTGFANDRDRIVRVWATHEPPDVWISGCKVPEGTRVRLRPGTYSCLARADNTEAWPAPKGFYFHFEDSSNVSAEREAWLASLRACRSELERIAQFGTRPAQADKAKQLLRALGDLDRRGVSHPGVRRQARVHRDLSERLHLP